MNGCSTPMNATTFTLNTNGTTNVSDISNAKLWYTGTSAIFAGNTQFGSTVTSPNGSFTITGSQSLKDGTNYFWLSYDVTAGATAGNFIDGACASVTIGGTARTPTTTTPAGSRKIMTRKSWIGVGSGGVGTDFNTAGNWSPWGVPGSTEEAYIATAIASTITMSQSATIGALTILNNSSESVTTILDIQTFILTVNGDFSQNLGPSGIITTYCELRIGNSPGALVVNGNSFLGNTGSVEGFVAIRGSGAGITTGKVVLKGNLTWGDGWESIGQTTSNIGTLVFDGSETQTLTTSPTYSIAFQASAITIGSINTPTVVLAGPNNMITAGATPTFTIGTNSKLDLRTFLWNKDIAAWTAGGSFIMNAGSTLKLAGTTGGQPGSNFPLSYTTAVPSLAASSIVEYTSADGANQTIYSTPTYGHLNLSNSAGSGATTKTAGGALTVAGDLTINANTTFSASTFTHNVGGNFTNNGGSYASGTSAIVLNGTIEQSINSGGSSFNNLTITNTGGTCAASTTGISVSGTFTTNVSTTLNMGTNDLSVNTIAHSGTLLTQSSSGTPLTSGKTWGGNVGYNASSGGQTVMPGTYFTLFMGNISGSQLAGGNISTTTLNNNASSGNILNMAGFALSGTTVNNTGTVRDP